MNYAHKIQQFIVDANAVENGDFTMTMNGKVVDVLVECVDNNGTGYNAIVGWNEKANKDILVPGTSKAYGVPERGFLDGNELAINFASSGSGSPRVLLTVWRQGDEIC